ncbi:SDR family oxidoreductase [Nocardioides coralli]|uniref:SDR family oxidoreductase n=1 Tax=Nocardioides coralli TaxID=2872154 RepID=UPI001CA3F550|nr:NAD(P)H-binding protein [Nocardioides coralli]QZY28854.1 NAD(P)H-binding protein [Nocardioides coralli]
MRVLVVGANGDVGSRTCAALLDRGVEVRGSVRELARGDGQAEQGVELVEADLTGSEGWMPALVGVDAVVLTANPVVPRRGDDPREVVAGTSRLIDDIQLAGVRRVVLASVPVGGVDDRVPFIRSRRRLEQRLFESGLETAILRFPPFMGAWLALVGSSIPLRGAMHNTIGRPSPFLQTFRRATGTLVEDRGVMLVPGSPSMRNAFIDEADVALSLAHAATADTAPDAPLEVGGPEVLTWRDVADTYAELLGRRVRILSTPAPVYAGLAALMRPAGVVPAHTMGLNRYLASTEAAYAPGGPGLDPSSMTTVRDYLLTKLAMSPELPEVV